MIPMKLYLHILAALVPLILLFGCVGEDRVNPEPDASGDQYAGPHSFFTLGEETEGLSATDVLVTLLSDEGKLFTRRAGHRRSAGLSSFRLDIGLAEGGYRLIDLRFDADATRQSETPGHAFDDEGRQIFGLGSHILVSAGGITVTDSYDRTMKMAGLGTQGNPYIISSSTHLFNLMMAVNDYDSNRQISENTYFQMVCDIDMKSMSRSCDSKSGWMPIGADSNTPFRGVFNGGGHAIKNLIIDRPASAAVGLFGNVHNALIDSLTMQGASVSGQYGVGAVAGAVITAGGSERGEGTFTNCTIQDCTVTTPSTGAAAGGVLGATDMHARTLIGNCRVSGGRLSGGMNIGGLTGGAGIYSSVLISGCRNESPVTASLSGAGGMIGTADTLQIAGCSNTALIRGGAEPSQGMPAIGTGGIAGGSGFSWITGCTNSGEVIGLEGTGGIIGSTRVKGSSAEAYVYNQTYLRWCANTADVTGSNFTGGAIGEAQAGAYGVVNTGKVKGGDCTGGLCGGASVAVMHNSVNGGSVEGGGNVAGILGKCTWGSLAILQNGGRVSGGSGNTAGIVALAGNNTIINYCANYGVINGPASAKVGGIAGEIGDPRKWTGMAIAECVIGTLECVMGLVGPCIAIAEESIAMAEGVEIAIKLAETSLEASLQSADYALVGYGISELVSPEAEEALEECAGVLAKEAEDDVNALMQDIRSKLKGDIPDYLAGDLSTDYRQNIEQLNSWYADGENEEAFNEAINETREKRAGTLEKAAQAREIAHTVVAGVAVVTSTIAAIAGTVATGGAATAFMLLGSSAAIVGGVNAITKSCNEFEKNAVVISQCVNAAPVNSHGNGNCAPICGRICDGVEIRDCLSTSKADADGLDIFTGNYGNMCDIHNCISLVMLKDFDLNTGSIYNNVFCDPSLGSGKTREYAKSRAAAPDRMADAGVYDKFGFRFGSDESWIIADNAYFPIPSRSQMQQ